MGMYIAKIIKKLLCLASIGKMNGIALYCLLDYLGEKPQTRCVICGEDIFMST